ncbi:MAG: hypothetical protein CSB06_03505 [Bacteroidia bacterium]|nr:MAG: hypothetical protein CSB06_03505 [Bacteroidia bacterium]
MDCYKVKFAGLEQGEHHYSFVIDKFFFEQFPETQIHNARVEIDLKMQLNKDLLTFHFFIKGDVEVECDRCLDSFFLPVKSEEKLYVEFGEENSDISDADNRIMLSYNEVDVDLSKHIYDYVHLALPVRKVHPEDAAGHSQCNEAMLNEIRNVNSKPEKDTDPRWDKLKELFNN